MQESDLERVFAAARADSPLPSSRLVAAVLADADALHQARVAVARAPRALPRRGRWAGWIADLGGTGVMAGLVTATLAGLWLGVTQPAPVSALTQTLAEAFAADPGLGTVELIPALDSFGADGGTEG